jgi:hypothetical protein
MKVTLLIAMCTLVVLLQGMTAQGAVQCFADSECTEGQQLVSGLSIELCCAGNFDQAQIGPGVYFYLDNVDNADNADDADDADDVDNKKKCIRCN